MYVQCCQLNIKSRSAISVVASITVLQYNTRERQVSLLPPYTTAITIQHHTTPYNTIQHHTLLSIPSTHPLSPIPINSTHYISLSILINHYSSSSLLSYQFLIYTYPIYHSILSNSLVYHLLLLFTFSPVTCPSPVLPVTSCHASLPPFSFLHLCQHFPVFSPT